MNVIATPLNRTLISAFGALLLTAPFVVMELSNLRGIGTFPFPLFVVLWFVAKGFLLSLATGIQMFRVEETSARKTLAILVALSSLFFAWFWIMLVVDQMPCFLGQGNCD